MNLPNSLTISRIFLTILFIFVVFYEGIFFKSLALGIFLLASLTDYLDGYWARQKGEITSFGRLMDPIADKLLTQSAFIVFVLMGLVPVWMALIIITRDVWITGQRLLMPAESLVVGARKSGKYKTAFQLAVIIGILIYLVLREMPFWQADRDTVARQIIVINMYLVVAITLWSGVLYIVKNKKLFH